MKSYHVALMIYGDQNSKRDALTEEKYKELAASFTNNGFKVSSVLFNDEIASSLFPQLLEYDAVLVWVNPIENGHDRNKLNELLIQLSNKGCFVSTHPDVILKMGTKEVLYKTKDMDWGGDIKMYTGFDDFVSRFEGSLKASKTRVLKQHRGNGGNGVFKIQYEAEDKVIITHATSGDQKRQLSLSDLYQEFNQFFLNDGLMIDQPWNHNISNGMVRCYLSGAKVAGFGYQEINALYELNGQYHPPGRRYYYTENCGLVSDLKEIMENKWVPELQRRLEINNEMMPVIWDADFFINRVNNETPIGKYSLCEINVSCVSPFPPSAIKYIVEEVRARIIT